MNAQSHCLENKNHKNFNFNKKYLRSENFYWLFWFPGLELYWSLVNQQAIYSDVIQLLILLTL